MQATATESPYMTYEEAAKYCRWPTVEVVEGDVQDGHQNVQDGHTTLNKNIGHLEQADGAQTRASGIDKPDVQDGHVVSSRWPDVQDGQRSSLPEGGNLERPKPVHVQDGHLDHLEECGHGYSGGKGCYLCDPNHLYRKKGGTA